LGGDNFIFSNFEIDYFFSVFLLISNKNNQCTLSWEVTFVSIWIKNGLGGDNAIFSNFEIRYFFFIFLPN